MIDLHVHTVRCRHGEGSAEEYVRSAARLGVRVIAFTEHLPLAPEIASRVPGAVGYAMPLEELGTYVEEVGAAAALGSSLGVEVLLGIEVDVVPRGYEHARTLLASLPFDLVLGSVHFIDDWAFDDPSLTHRYAEWSLEDLWVRYLDDLAAAARSGLADVLAHADLVKKFSGPPGADMRMHYRNVAAACADAGVAVEVNTAGLRKPCAEIYPSLDFLRELRRAGVGVTIGSDAHRPQEVGADGDGAVSLLREAGYSSVLVFRGRIPEEVGIDAL